MQVSLEPERDLGGVPEGARQGELACLGAFYPRGTPSSGTSIGMTSWPAAWTLLSGQVW